MQDLAHASDALAEAGIALPRWVDLPRHGPARATDDADPDDPDVPYRGWQCSAFRVLDDRGSAEHRRAVGPAELAFLDSQFGNLALSPQGCVAHELALDPAFLRRQLRRSSDHRLQDRGQPGGTDGRQRTQGRCVLWLVALQPTLPQHSPAPGHTGRSKRRD